MYVPAICQQLNNFPNFSVAIVTDIIRIALAVTLHRHLAVVVRDSAVQINLAEVANSEINILPNSEVNFHRTMALINIPATDTSRNMHHNIMAAVE